MTFTRTSLNYSYFDMNYIGKNEQVQRCEKRTFFHDPQTTIWASLIKIFLLQKRKDQLTMFVTCAHLSGHASKVYLERVGGKWQNPNICGDNLPVQKVQEYSWCSFVFLFYH